MDSPDDFTQDIVVFKKFQNCLSNLKGEKVMEHHRGGYENRHSEHQPHVHCTSAYCIYTVHVDLIHELRHRLGVG